MDENTELKALHFLNNNNLSRVSFHVLPHYLWHHRSAFLSPPPSFFSVFCVSFSSSFISYHSPFLFHYPPIHCPLISSSSRFLYLFSSSCTHFLSLNITFPFNLKFSPVLQFSSSPDQFQYLHHFRIQFPLLAVFEHFILTVRLRINFQCEFTHRKS